MNIKTQVPETSNTNESNEGEITQVTQTENTNPYDKQAREMGWRPKEEWEGEPEKWRDAKEFVERGELYGKIDSSWQCKLGHFASGYCVNEVRCQGH